MLARAAQRRLRNDALHAHEQLTLPWLCPAQLRRTASLSAAAAHPHSPPRRPRRPSPSPPTTAAASPRTRALATAAEMQPSPSASPFHGFMQAWGSRTQAPDLARMPAWDPANPLVIFESRTTSPGGVNASKTSGIGGDSVELHQNLYACLKVGRLERAEAILTRMMKLYRPSAPEAADAHNAFLQTLFELTAQEARPDAMASITDWYAKNMVRRRIEPTAHTFVTLLRAAINFLDGDAQDEAIRGYMAQAKARHVLDAVNESDEFWDEEWDAILRAQPDDYHPPPHVAEVQDALLNGPAARQGLMESGLLPPDVTQKIAIAPVAQKGLGLDTLVQSLAVFTSTERVPYPHDMAGTQEEKDRAYAYARQVHMEQDALDASVLRWQKEDKKLSDMGIHGVLSTKPIKALMSNWHAALVPLFKKHMATCKEVLSASSKENARHPAHTYGPWLERMKPERLSAITISRFITHAVAKNLKRGHGDKVSSLSTALGKDFMIDLNADAQSRRDAFLKKQRKQMRKELLNKLHKTPLDPESPPPVAPHFSAYVEKENMPMDVRVKLGALGIELMLQSATLTVTAEDRKTGKTVTMEQAAYLHRMEYVHGKKIGHIVPHHKLLEKLRNESVEHIFPSSLPMVHEPKPWSSFQDGGYYTVPQRVVRQKYGDTAQKAYAKSAIENGDMTKVLAGLDVLGKVPWQINGPVLNVMVQAWNNGEETGGLIRETSTLEPPEETPADASPQERAKRGKKLQEFWNLKAGLHSQRCFQNFQLEIASAFVGEKKIFFPHSVDFRGRAYPIPPILNHIGADLARGLLKFANGKELGTVGLQWLKIHLANLYGFDKASLTEREQFAMDNISEIYDSATNPLDGRKWWAKAEDPWQTLACCMELKNAFDSPDPTRYKSQLPVHQDGTCNGLQHYAALGGDLAGARQVNLEPSDRPQDIYTGVAELVKEMVAEEAKQGLPIASFINGYISRKVVKRTVMTNVYGVTFMGAKAQVEDTLREIFPKFQESDKVKSLGSVALYIAFKIFEALGKIFNGAQEIQYWLGECGDRITSSLDAEQIKQIQARHEGKPSPSDPKFKDRTRTARTIAKETKSFGTFKTSIIWTTPLKMPVVQPYRKDSTSMVQTKLQKITVLKHVTDDAVDKRKQLQAFPPNFIHSLDATHMTLSALKCGEMGLDFAAVHDSFWTHASDIPNLNVILRDAFVRMHSEDVIGRLAEEFKARHAGAMYTAKIYALSEAGIKIRAWRSRLTQERQQLVTKVYPHGVATYEELALESRRQELLNSEDPEEVKQGEAMVTPTSIWLEHQDPKSMSSFRLSLLGEVKVRGKKKLSNNAYERMRDKVLDHEAEVLAEEKKADGSTADEPKLEHVDEVTPEAEEAPEPEEAAAEAPEFSATHSLTVWTPLVFPPVPKKGDWDVSRLRESQYFFS